MAFEKIKLQNHGIKLGFKLKYVHIDIRKVVEDKAVVITVSNKNKKPIPLKRWAKKAVYVRKNLPHKIIGGGYQFQDGKIQFNSFRIVVNK